MIDSSYTITNLFDSLAGESFSNYGGFEERVRRLFILHRSSFPIAYDPRKAIRCARERKLVYVEDDLIQIRRSPHFVS
jgi:hypothetical protein